MPKRVLVVEGEDDKTFIESLLTRSAPGAWEAHWVIGEAGGKSNLSKLLENDPQWLGLVDKDEWTAADAAAQQALFPNRLFILPRYCMESYFVVPSELWAMLEPTQQANVANGQLGFEATLSAPVAQWVRHGALWHTVNPLWNGLHSLGFKDALLDFTASQQPDPAILAILQQWHAYLDPLPIMANFQAALATAQAAPFPDQVTQWVHGKRFFREHIATSLPHLLGVPQQPANQALANLQKRMTVPADLLPIWQAIGLP